MWITDYQPEFRRRSALYNKLIADPALLAKVMAFYKTHAVEFINDWCVTVDPRVSKGGKVMPFVLFPRQVDFVNFIVGCLNDKESGLIEKSRDMGATWLCVCISAWLWAFHPGVIVGWGSNKAENVDDRGNPKAIFHKLRQTILNLPPFMRPLGFNPRFDMPFMKILHPYNSSTITGESGDNIGRGGRTTIYFKDESAHYERPELIEASLGDNTDVQIDISSVNGTGNVFYRRRQAGEIWYPDKPCAKNKVRIFIFDWRENPLKSQEWYDNRKQKAADEGLLHVFAQEVDRNYSASVDRLIIPPEWVNAAVDAHKKLNLPSEGEKMAGQDVADSGGDKNALVIRHGIVVRFADCWGGDAGQAAQTAVPYCSEYGVRELYFDSIGVGTGFKTEINHMQVNGQLPGSLRVMPWNAGSSPMDPEDNIIPGDSQSPTNDEQYLNLKAQSWFRMRARFNKTHQAVTHGKIYPSHELISLDSSLPRLHELKNELSQAQYKAGAKGKTIVDKKPDGSHSPNLADACVMAFNPTRELSIFDVL